ncbi:MAG TPA: hypothetical protein VM370_10780 [Candidatus Thermoplasmatota archaeon]|nr:hypothetical protein [Candidatus Thermoplasmatota archaeon]
MGMLAFGIVLVLVGLVLAFTNVLGLATLSQPLIWLGWVCVAIGIVLALIYAFSGRRNRDVVVEREYRRPGYP